MPCDTRLRKNQTIQQRADEVKKAVSKLSEGLASGRITAKVGPQGAIAFVGFEADRNGVTDACAYRRLLVQGSPLARVAIQKAEMLAGRTVSRSAVNLGVHSHDGGETWHRKG